MFEGIIYFSIYKTVAITTVLVTCAYINSRQLVTDDFDHPYQFDMLTNSQRNNQIQLFNTRINMDFPGYLNIKEVIIAPRTVYQNNPKPINDVYGTNSFIINRYPTGCTYGPKLKPIDHGAWVE